MTTTTRTADGEPRCSICGDREGLTDPFADYEQSRGDETHKRCLTTRRAKEDRLIDRVNARSNDDKSAGQQHTGAENAATADDPFAGIVDTKHNDPWDAS